MQPHNDATDQDMGASWDEDWQAVSVDDADVLERNWLLRNQGRIYQSVLLFCLFVLLAPLAIAWIIRIHNNPRPITIALKDYDPVANTYQWLILTGGEFRVDQLHASFNNDNELVSLAVPYVLPTFQGGIPTVVAETSDKQVLKLFDSLAHIDGTVDGSIEQKLILLGVKQGILEGWRRPLDPPNRQHLNCTNTTAGITIGMKPDSLLICYGMLAIGLCFLFWSTVTFAKAWRS